jgi:phenylacetic acid degradation operon negative regulatory protein
LIVTIFGDSLTPHGGSIWLTDLVELIAPFDINDRLVRTSVFRLTEEGWLESKRNGRRSLYSLTPSGSRRFQHAYQRVYPPPDKTTGDSWTLVLLPRMSNSIPERVELKKKLEWEGFGTIAPGVFIHPAADTVVLTEILDGLGLRKKVVALCAKDIEAVAARPAAELISHCWNLSDLAGLYRDFVVHFKPVSKILESEECDAQQAFLVRTLLIHSFRRVTLHDPRLPIKMLPPDWPGIEAYMLFRDLYRACFKLSETFLKSRLKISGNAIAKPAAELFQRFDTYS